MKYVSFVALSRVLRCAQDKAQQDKGVVINHSITN